MANTITMDLFYDRLMGLLKNLETKEMGNIKKAAAVCADSIANDGVIHVFGSGHSVGFGLEMTGRPGSLIPVHPIQSDDFVMKGKFDYATFRSQDVVFERRPGIADQLYNLYNIHKNDCFIIISNSGINGLVIDMAITAKNNGHKVIVVTSWEHTNSEASRHPSGRKLYQLGDVVIDNCGPCGDALLETGNIEKICSVSSITGAFIAQSIEIETVNLLSAEGKKIPLLQDESIPGYQEHNSRLLKHYEGRI